MFMYTVNSEDEPDAWVSTCMMLKIHRSWIIHTTKLFYDLSLASFGNEI